MYRKILVANDGSEGEFKALAAAIDLADRYRAELHMICVEELPRFPATIDEVVEEREQAGHRFAKVIARAQSAAKAKNLKLNAHVVAGHAVPAIINCVKERGIDLLVLGFMGHSAVFNRLIGSTADRLVEHAPCTVLVAK